MLAKHSLWLGLLIALPIALGPACAAESDGGSDVPESVLKNIDESVRLTGRPKSQQEHVAMLVGKMQQVLKLSGDAEKQYPQASNLHLVRVRMLRAADFLARYDESSEATKTRLAISRRLLASDAPADVKVTADYFVTLEKIKPIGGKTADDAEAQIRAYLQRYAKKPEEAESLARASQLAKETDLSPLREEIFDTLETDHVDKPEIHAFLRRAGRKMPFQADLTLVDGKKLALPGDLLGKVVVIDFWATWCGPCRVSLPHMKQVYAKVKSKGVEFVGVSLDRPDQKQALVDFIKKEQLGWLHSYSGKFWEDPTARKYGVSGIPSIWVIGKDGKIFSENARADLEGTIDRALAQPAAAE